jgi:effector-binding domain-containing protein
MLKSIDLEIREKQLEPLVVAGLRWKGRYDETGKAFQRLGQLAGRYIAGKAMNLYYDGEYKESDADIESCFAVRKGLTPSSELAVHTLPAGRCVSLIHKGPYNQLGRAYERIFEHIQQKGYELLLPIREIYLKGPGMIFKGNPKNYLTEIQILIAAEKEREHESTIAGKN